MAQQTKTQTKTWAKPELAKLGKLVDVAQSPNPGPQGAGTKT